jgi:inner membrane protein
MPSPVGHAVAGIASAWLVAGVPERRRALKESLLFGALAMAPDIDLLFGAHSGPTHSLGATMLVAAAALLAHHRIPWLPAATGLRPTLFLLACAAAYSSHVLLDWLATDSMAPIGIMALWPLNRQHYESDWHVFMAISRRFHQGWSFITHNALALAWEMMLLLPALSLVMTFRRRRT